MKRILKYPVATLRGAGQVMFQASPACGALFVAAICAGSLGIGGAGHIVVFLGAVASLMLATAFGFVLRDKESVDGLCGFNAILVGSAAFTFLSASVTVGAI